jgi:hypothetical protein
MRKCLLLFLILGSFSAFGQSANHVFTVSPFGTINKVRVKYEKPLSNSFSLGTFVSGYYGAFRGVQVAPIVRAYLSGDAPSGFYLQGKALASFHTRVYSAVINGTEITSDPHSFSSYGGGFGIGYQVLLGKKKNISLDFGIGAKLMTAVPSPGKDDGFDAFTEGLDNFTFFTVGPGSFFDGLIAIGIAF